MRLPISLAIAVGAACVGVTAPGGAADLAPAEPNMAAVLSGGQFVAAVPRNAASLVAVYAAGRTGIESSAQFTVPFSVRGLAARRDGTGLLAWDDHAAYAVHPAKRSHAFLWRSPNHILQLADVYLPGDSRPEVLALSAEAFEDGHWRNSHLDLITAGPPRRLSPPAAYNFWALSVADVDGGGSTSAAGDGEDVGLCTYSRTVRDASYAQRFFVYGWGPDGDLYPKWRGSRLCRPYAEAALVPAVRGALLASRETGLTGGSVLATYAWNQFGFWGAGETDELPGAETPRLADLDGDGRDELIAVCTDAAAARRVTAFALREGRWVPVQCSDPLPPGHDYVAVASTGGAIIVAFANHGDPMPRPLPLRPVERGLQDAG